MPDPVNGAPAPSTSAALDTSVSRAALIARVCAVHAFHPTAVPGFSAADCLRLVRRDVDVIAIDEDRTAWSLRREIRHEALDALGSAARALEAARSILARPLTPTQSLFERWLAGQIPSPLTDKELDLGAVATVVDWLEHTAWAGDDARRIRGELYRASQRARFEAIGGAHFVGRTTERDRLRDVAEGRSTERLVVIDALGGMGKSALLARAALDVGAKGAIAIALVDLDDVEVDPRSRVSVLAAVVRQLEAQDRTIFGGVAAALQTLGSAGNHASAIEAVEYDSQVLFALEQTTSALKRAVAAGIIKRVFVIVDTFERALRRSPEIARGVVDILWRVIVDAPAAIVIAGRGIGAATEREKSFWPVPPDVLRLTEFDETSAITLLRDQKLANATLVQNLVHELPLRPLTLRLAARAVLAEGEESAFDIQKLRSVVRRALIDGYLHLRELGHLDDERLREIVHVGFALRRVTPAAILHILRDWPRPPVRDDADARLLFDALRRVHHLVTETADEDGLVLRPEVRKELLELMEEDRRRDFLRVHSAAADWFLGQDGAAAKTELVYHLLSRLDFSAAEKHWTPSMASDLALTTDVLPEAARIWLSEHTSNAHTSPPSGPRSRDAWDHQMSARANDLFATHRLEGFDELLAQWKSGGVARGGLPPNSALPIVQAQLARIRGQVDAAAAAAKIALTVDRPAVIADEMQRVLVWVAAQAGDVSDLLQRIDTLRSKATTGALSAKERLASLVDLVSILMPRHEPAMRRARWNLEDDVAAAFDASDDASLRTDGALLIAAGACFRDAPRLLRALHLGALERVREPYVDGLAVALREQGRALADQLDWTASAAEVSWDRTGPFPWHEVLAVLGQQPQLLEKLLETLLRLRDVDERIVESIRWLFAKQARAEEDTSPKRVQDRQNALRALASFLEQYVPPLERKALLARLGIRLETNTSIHEHAAALVGTLDSAAQLQRFGRALMNEHPEHAPTLWTMRYRAARRPPFCYFAHERIRSLYEAFAESSLVRVKGFEEVLTVLDPRLAGAPTSAPSQVRLIESLERLNEIERLGGTVPMTDFLQQASRLPLGEPATSVIGSLLNELVERRGDPRARDFPIPDVGPLEAALRAQPTFVPPAGLRDRAEDISRAVAKLSIFGKGRDATDISGGRALVSATAWLLAPDLLVTAWHVVQTGSAIRVEDLDADDIEARASFEDGQRRRIRSIVAANEALDYALLSIEPVSLPALPVSGGPFGGGALMTVYHSSTGKRTAFGVGFAPPIGSTRLCYLLGLDGGSSGAPIVDSQGRVQAIEQVRFPVPSREDVMLDGGVSMHAVLSDLSERFAQVFARISAIEAPPSGGGGP